MTPWSMTGEAELSMRSLQAPAVSLTVSQLGTGDEAEVLEFLSARPLHTVFMAGFIRDNGLVSSLNRGTFYGCRDSKSELRGVALIGHATMVEARDDAALTIFARLAHSTPDAYLIMGEQEKIEQFWSHYSQSGQQARLVCRELLLEKRWSAEEFDEVSGLRTATLDELTRVMQVQAEMAFQESGINPLERDPEGFRSRCARRIEQGRIWVWVEDGRLIFKADIMCETPDVVYLEGVYIDPRERGRGLGWRCFLQMSRSLLARTRSICLFVNEENKRARAFYEKVGYELRSYYDTIFLQQKN